jgi:hypothetical protein
MAIQRYNQGFGFFGPLEKCDTGKLVIYADMVEYCIGLADQVTDETERRVVAEAWAEKRTRDVIAHLNTIEVLRTRIYELENKGEVARLELRDANSRGSEARNDLGICKTVNQVLFGYGIFATVGIALLITKLFGNL